jgi:hypothetical protein
MFVKLAIDCAKLKSQDSFESLLVQLESNGKVRNLLVLEVVKTGFKTETAFFERAKFLIAQTHIVEECKSVCLISPAFRHVNHVQNSMRFLKQS